MSFPRAAATLSDSCFVNYLPQIRDNYYGRIVFVFPITKDSHNLLNVQTAETYVALHRQFPRVFSAKDSQIGWNDYGTEAIAHIRDENVIGTRRSAGKSRDASLHSTRVCEVDWIIVGVAVAVVENEFANSTLHSLQSQTHRDHHCALLNHQDRLHD